jgi:hypothetical protein
VEAIDEDTLEAMLETGWHILLNIGEQQHQVVSEEKPVELYLGALEQMFAQGTIYLRHKDRPDMVEEIWPKHRTGTAEMLGWYDEYFWYLLPKAAYSAVWQFHRCSGIIFADSERGVRVKLLEEKILQPQGDRFTYRLRLGDDLVRVLRISRVALENLSTEAGTSGTTGTTGTDGEEPPKAEQIPF